MEEKTGEVLVRVEHLCQYFKMGAGRELKAVDDVSFDVKKGEVFGLVGESGCGKTTTGRSIIKLYDITSGSVYFKDQRICAGTRSYEDAIKKARGDYKKEIAELRGRYKTNELGAAEYKEGVSEKRAALKAAVAEQKALIRAAKDDHKNCEKKYLRRLKEEYAGALAAAGGDESGLTEEQKRKFRSVRALPELPKKYLVAGYILLFALSFAFLVSSICTNISFKRKYGSYSPVSAIVVSSDEAAGTTEVSYEVANEQNETETYTAVLEYYDPELGVSTAEQTVRLRIYYNESDPTQTLLEAPHSSKATAFAALFFGFAAAGLVLAVYVHERYSSSRLITKIQMIFQDPVASLDPRMTVRDIIAEGLVIEGIKDKKYIDEQVYKMLELVGLVPEHAERYPHEFSGGQRQRIGVARAVVMQPELIIADEPISALDVSIQAQVINLLNDLRRKLGLTVLFIAHDLSVVKYFSDRIGVMYFGKMVELADSDELFAHPLHPYTKSLLSAIPLPDPDYEKKRRRFIYDPLAEHDYSVDKPSMREVAPGHFVMCNQAEFDRYQKELSKEG